MPCPTCGATNRTSAAFCQQCGRLLAGVCPRCRTAAGPVANFCDACGYPLSPQAWTGAWPQPLSDPLLTSPSPPETLAVPVPSVPSRSLERFMPRELLDKMIASQGTAAERRVVTMLFCDIQGSTSLAERLDPEEWTEIVNAAFEQMVNPIFKYEGTVARLMGDGLLAFFGAPVAHEDDPRRAVLAGLAIVDGIRAWRESLPVASDLAVRVGINTGLVVVGAIGSDLRLEYSAIGDAINLAARMEQAAAPGTVQIAEDTYRLVADLFEVEPLGEIQVKGKIQPVPAYRVLRRAASPDRWSRPAHRAALVNRRMEWAAIERAFNSMSAGRGGIVFLIGEAGLGKTRLIEEAIERLLPDLAPDARLYDVSAVSYEATQPYGLLARLMRQALGLVAGDPPDQARARIGEAVGDIADSEVLEMLFGLSTATNGQEISADQFGRQLVSCLERFWEARAADPLVIALDELQWLDASSADCLAALFALTESAPILFLCALRRERQSTGWRLLEITGRELPHRMAEVVLHPLSDGESRQLVGRLLDQTHMPDALASVILEKAEGNPLFLEEVVRHLMERGVLRRSEDGQWVPVGQADISLPDSLLALLTARIDRLDEPTRRALQVASVIGRQFARSTLMALVDDPSALDRHLSQLQRMELVQETRRVPEPSYSFHHNLIQEAVYNTILLRQRRTLHLRAAGVLAARQETHPAAVASMLAHHLIEGDAPERALPYLLLAAGNALRLHAPAEAIAHYQRALPIALNEADNSGTLIEILNNHGRALELQSRFAEAKALYDEFERLAIERHDQTLELNALIALGKLHSNVTPFYDAAHGRALMERAREMAEATHDQAAEVRVLWNLVNIDRFGVNTLDQAIATGERGLALASELELGEELAYLLNDVGDLYGMAGQFDKSQVMLTKASDQWRQLGNEAMLADNLSSTAVWNSVEGNFRDSILMANEAHEITLRLGNIWGEAYSLSVKSHALANLGEIGLAIAGVESGVAKARAAGFMGGLIISQSYLSHYYLEVGDIESAIDRARDGVEIARIHLPQFAAMCVGRLILALIENGEVEEAAEIFADPLSSLEQQQVINKYPMALAAIELTLAQQNLEDAAQLAAALVTPLEQIGAAGWLPTLWHSWGRAMQALGRLDEAAELLARAVATARAIDLRLGRWQILVTWAQVEQLKGDHNTAASLWSEAAAEIEYLAEQIYPDEIRRSFLARPQVRQALLAAGRTDSI